jgi:hypothetical protein
VRSTYFSCLSCCISSFHLLTSMSQSSSNRSVMSFLTSNTKKRLLCLDSYIYQQNKSTSKVTYWICEEKMCWAGVHLDSNDRFLKSTKTTHNHLPTPERQEVRKMFATIKDRVVHETTAIGQIYNEELSRTNLSEAALATAHTARAASKNEISQLSSESDGFLHRFWPQSNASADHAYSCDIHELQQSGLLPTNKRSTAISACRSYSTS